MSRPEISDTIPAPSAKRYRCWTCLDQNAVDLELSHTGGQLSKPAPATRLRTPTCHWPHFSYAPFVGDITEAAKFYAA